MSVMSVGSVLVSDDAREAAQVKEESARVAEAVRRRQYYAGQQYDEENRLTADALGCDPLKGNPLPEHKRKHAYSTQIGECIDFLADRLGEGFVVKAVADPVQQVIDAFVESSDLIGAANENGVIEVVADALLRDAFQTGDVPVYVGWDPVEGRVYPEFWESEKVEFVYETTRKVQKVIRREVVWRRHDDGEMREVTERHEYELARNEAGVMEAQRTLWWDQEDAPRETEWLGLGRLPWVLLRADRKSLRALRGQSLISEQAMGTADRYNAVEQVSWLIARYNSHGNLAVIGDGASLRLESDGRQSKDVADVLTFPGGTALQVLQLPTDAQMIEHQRGVLADALYHVFGLTRVEPDTLQGLGGVTGYALEILNQKAEATFRRIGRQWRQDFLGLLSLVLDVHAWKQTAPIGMLDPTTLAFEEFDGDPEEMVLVPGLIPVQAWWTIDPDTVFPNRTVEIQMGSGYIVDEVMIRDDFVAGLISLEEALRRRGYDPKKIKEIVSEIDARAPQEETGRSGVPGAPAPSGTQAGRTVGSTRRSGEA